MLTNRAYIREREINKKHRWTDEARPSEDEKYFCVKANWEPLISEELFFDVQNLLEQNKKKARKYVHNYRLTGLLVCAECGEILIGKSGNSKSGKYFYYGHKRKMLIHGNRHNERCKTENIPAPTLEEGVIARVKQIAGNRAILAELVKATANQ